MSCFSGQNELISRSKWIPKWITKWFPKWTPRWNLIWPFLPNWRSNWTVKMTCFSGQNELSKCPLCGKMPTTRFPTNCRGERGGVTGASIREGGGPRSGGRRMRKALNAESANSQSRRGNTMPSLVREGGFRIAKDGWVVLIAFPSGGVCQRVATQLDGEGKASLRREY